MALAVVAERGEHPRHLAGRPGIQLFDGLMAWQGWVRRGAGRDVAVTPPGQRALLPQLAPQA